MGKMWKTGKMGKMEVVHRIEYTGPKARPIETKEDVGLGLGREIWEV